MSEEKMSAQSAQGTEEELSAISSQLSAKLRDMPPSTNTFPDDLEENTRAADIEPHEALLITASSASSLKPQAELLSTQHSAPGTTNLGLWLQRTRRSLALWRDDNYRRDAYQLMLYGLRGMVGARMGVALLLLAGVAAWVLATTTLSPRDGFDLLARLFGVATILAAAPLYTADQKQGTFELLWLATGSQRGLLIHKISTLLIGLTLLMIPSVIFVSWYLYGGLPTARTFFFLITNSLLIISIMALAGTLLTQAWAGGLVGAGIVVAGYLLTKDVVSPMNPFLNPVGKGVEVLTGGGAFQKRVQLEQLLPANRILVVGISVVLLQSAASRLKKAFR